MRNNCRRKHVSDSTTNGTLKTMTATLREVIAVCFAPTLELFTLCKPLGKGRQKFLDLATYSPDGRLIREVHSEVQLYCVDHKQNMLEFINSTTLLTNDPQLVLFSSRSGKLIHKTSAIADCFSVCTNGNVLALSRIDGTICRYALVEKDKGSHLKQIDSIEKVPVQKFAIYECVREIDQNRVLFVTANSMEVLGRIYANNKQISLVNQKKKKPSCFFLIFLCLLFLFLLLLLV